MDLYGFLERVEDGVDQLELVLVDVAAKMAPWLAPLPSAFFVGRATMGHLGVPWPVAVVIAAAIESLGISTVATALWLYTWNQESLTPAGNLRRGRTLAPVGLLYLAVGMGGLYLAVTIGLTVLLEVAPALATAAPAVFPLLAVVGAVNLAIRANQARREDGGSGRSVGRSKRRSGGRSDAGSSRSGGRSGAGSADRQDQASLGHANRVRRLSKRQAEQELVAFYDQNPGASHREAGEAVGRSKSWVTLTLGRMEDEGRIRRNGSGVEVLEEAA